MGLICPHCGHATSRTPVVIEDGKALLPDRSDDMTSVYEKARVFAVTDYGPGNIAYGVFRCQECSQWYLAKQERYEDWVVVYPISQKPVAKEILEPLKNFIEEANLCFAIGAYIGCLLVCRTVVIALQREQGVTNLQELVKKGTLSKALYDQTDEVRLWANILGHEDIMPESVTREDCEQLLAYMDAVMNAVYVEPARLEALKKKREQIQRKSDKETDE